MEHVPSKPKGLLKRAYAKSVGQRLGRLSLLRDATDIAAKLAAPAAVILGAILAHSFQSSLSVTQLLSAREESDTKIRAEMFKAITERLFRGEGGDKGGDLTPERQAVFAELLALNFHEHIELKPLLSEVDSGLIARKAAQQDAKEQRKIEAKREELRAVARRVRARQTAMLYRPTPGETSAAGIWASWLPSAQAAEQERSYKNGRLRMIGVRFRGYRPGHGLASHSPCDVVEMEGQNTCVREPVFENAPDGKGALAVTVTEEDGDKQSFLLQVKPLNSLVPEDGARDQAQGSITGPVAECGRRLPDSKKGGFQASQGVPSVQFETTWFDFPLTDNTLLASGARYAIFIDQVCYDNKQRLEGAKLGLLWFPRDYFPARERPTNHRQLREKLNLPVGE